MEMSSAISKRRFTCYDFPPLFNGCEGNLKVKLHFEICLVLMKEQYRAAVHVTSSWRCPSEDVNYSQSIASPWCRIVYRWDIRCSAGPSSGDTTGDGTKFTLGPPCEPCSSRVSLKFFYLEWTSQKDHSIPRSISCPHLQAFTYVLPFGYILAYFK